MSLPPWRKELKVLHNVSADLERWEKMLGRGQDHDNLLSWIGNSKERDRAMSECQRQQLYEMDFHRLFLAKKYGGERQNWLQLWMKVALSTRRNINVMPLVMYSIGPLALLEMVGSDEQQIKATDLLLCGEQFCFGLSEPGIGTQLAKINSKAVATDDGWTLSGHKGPMGWSAKTSQFILLVKTGDEGPTGLSFVWVNASDPTITIERYSGLGMVGQDFVDLHINSLKISEESFVGCLGQGLEATLKVQQLVKFMSTAANMGACHSLLRDVASYAMTIRNDRVLTDYSHVRGLLASVTATLLVLEATAFVTASLLNASQTQFSVLSSVLKQFALESSDFAIKLLRDIVSVNGVLERDAIFSRFSKIVDDLMMVRYIDTNPVINLKNIATQLPAIHWQLHKLTDEKAQHQLDQVLDLLELKKNYFAEEKLNIAVTNSRGDLLCNSIRAMSERLYRSADKTELCDLVHQLQTDYEKLWMRMELLGSANFADSGESIELAVDYVRISGVAATVLFWVANPGLQISESLLVGLVNSQRSSQEFKAKDRKLIFDFLQIAMTDNKAVSWVPIGLFE
jgi:alkylation response protein AidB-like acyl-CoA dehydrogenase